MPRISSPALHTVFDPFLPSPTHSHITWGQLHGSSPGLLIASAQNNFKGLILLVTPDMQSATELEQELMFYAAGGSAPIHLFPDWETLPYDVFSPHEDIISQRLEILYQLPSLSRGVLIVPINTLMQRLGPRDYLELHSLMLDKGQQLDREVIRQRLSDAGYSFVAQVVSHGECAIRGSLIDLYPMGSRLPYRIDLFDDEIESIRIFDPEKQISQGTVEQVRLLPAREMPVDADAIKRFRQNYRSEFAGDPSASLIYREVSDHALPPGIEYYLPLFYDQTQSLFDYLPAKVLCVFTEEVRAACEAFDRDIHHRYEQRRHNVERPLLSPERLFLSPEEIEARFKSMPSVRMISQAIEHPSTECDINYATAPLPDLKIQPSAADSDQALSRFLAGSTKTLFVAESAGRREHLLDVLRDFQLRPATIESWQGFLQSDMTSAITVAPLTQGLHLLDPQIVLITEDQLLGSHAQQRRRRKASLQDTEAIIRNLTDLHLNSPVVHEEHGVGRYLGLQKLTIGGKETEFLTLEYAGGDKLYVPVASLHLISRYTGGSPDQAPLHKLGNDQWQKIKRKAAARIRDVAAELLELHARRAAKPGMAFTIDHHDYMAFAAAFPFEETPDQERAIEDVFRDMASPRPMDRVVCGDVGFGKTEVAMRAAFIATQNGKQVAVLVPTTLLAQQHFQNFSDRFADWPVRIEPLSRFQSQKQQKVVLQGLSDGRIDIVIGTHKLLQARIKFRDLGLVIIDEEHRFGVRHKEQLKNLRAELDLLTLTATPIPRTLNMSLSGLRDLSIIATPPLRRHTVKTFINQWHDDLIREAVEREIKRGGQVYFLHNNVETIEKTAKQVQQLIPTIKLRIAHGKMPERTLEQVMLDFYHQRFNVLVCSTIIESGIDVPTANTILINRADKLGLSQLHQLRGRVGRSHHRAYAYLIVPPKGAMTADAVKRLEAIESLEDLGIGFTLATHDLEIRGAGELLGEEQSGQIHEIGFSLYNELLERAVKALRSGEIPDLQSSPSAGTEIDLGVPALIPDDYIPDVHLRLILYKRIASAASEDDLRELQVEMIDRFGLLPEYARNLFELTYLKLRLRHLDILKIEVGHEGGRLVFGPQPKIDTAKLVKLVQSRPQIYSFDGENCLRFTAAMTALQQRIDMISDLTSQLAIQQAA